MKELSFDITSDISLLLVAMVIQQEGERKKPMIGISAQVKALGERMFLDS